MANDKARLLNEVATLKEQLAATRSSSSDDVTETITGLQLKLEAYDLERVEVSVNLSGPANLALASYSICDAVEASIR